MEDSDYLPDNKDLFGINTALQRNAEMIERGYDQPDWHKTSRPNCYYGTSQSFLDNSETDLRSLEAF